MSQLLNPCRLAMLGLLSLASTAWAQSSVTIGVLALNSNTPNPEAAWISRGMADMLTTDLAKVSKLTVVQREQLDKVLKEQALGASGAVDSTKAVQLGKLLGAQTLLTGSYAAIGKNVRVDLQLINATTGRVESGVTAEGSIDAIFSLEKQLVLAVIGKLGVTPTVSEMQSLMQSETFNTQALVLNYQALAKLQSDPKAAAQALQQAVNLDPNYTSAQQNLRTALSLSGTSLANAAILDLELKAKEIQAARKAIEFLKSAIRISDVKLQTPTTDAARPGLARVDYTYTIGFPDGTMAAVANLMAPYSREGQDRREMTFILPGVARGGEKTLSLARETMQFFTNHLQRFSVAATFYGSGSEPVYMGKIMSENAYTSSLDSHISTSKMRDGMSAGRKMSMYIPITLLSKLTTSKIAVIASEGEENETQFVRIPFQDAKELGIPEGYLKARQIDSSNPCVVEAKSGRIYDWNTLPPVNEITVIKGLCEIYTKINDAIFTEEILREKLENGEDFNVTIYNTATKSSTTRRRNSLIPTSVKEFDYTDYYGIKFSEKINSVPRNADYYYFNFTPFTSYYNREQALGFSINHMF